jgi:outer membrane receptor protein involved in Fe transport
METHDVVVGVNNVFDKEPPLVGAGLSWGANTVPGFWDTLGRYGFVNVTLRW